PLLNLSSRNVVREGTACSETDTVADPFLDELGYPLENSPGIDGADPSWATPRDIRGVLRDDAPDIGAFEYLHPPSSI
ncbi:MAG: choice-of-anchor Q domain-containing protein, partial [Gaiellaceae bacterium]